MNRAFLLFCAVSGAAAAQPMTMPMPPAPTKAAPTKPAPASPVPGALPAAAASAKPTAVTVTVAGAWARATAPGQTEGAAYLTLTSPDGDRLIGVDADVGAMAMLHLSRKANGVAEMRDLDALALPAGKATRLSPGGVHIMLMDLKAPLKPGDQLHLSLSFAKAGRRDIIVPVKPIGASGP